MIIGKKYRNCLENALNKHNISLICSPDNIYSDERLSGHIDLIMTHMGKNRIYAAEFLHDSELIHKLSDRGFKFEFEFIANPVNKHYPNDAVMNVCIIGDCVICNLKSADKRLIEGRKIIRCNQGYTKCSVLVVNENSLITSDKMIADKSAHNGLEVLLIDDSFVRLDGFNKGFIGGASFKISKNKIAFTGRISDKNSEMLIERFLIERGISAVYLTDEEIFDIGSAMPIIEEA
ncbi:MAG: hypothetical protein HUJ66_03870 [Oscillospiraceae bacterium]|nr:hypothetical protein [Oscillospiraceae bacterium]